MRVGHGAVQPEAEAYWLQFAATGRSLWPCSLDHPRPALKSFRGETLRGTIERFPVRTREAGGRAQRL